MRERLVLFVSRSKLESLQSDDPIERKQTQEEITGLVQNLSAEDKPSYYGPKSIYVSVKPNDNLDDNEIGGFWEFKPNEV